MDLIRGVRNDNMVEIPHLFLLMTLIFCQSSLNIKLNKSEMVKLGDKRDYGKQASVLGCRTVKLPIKYLGPPLGFEI